MMREEGGAVGLALCPSLGHYSSTHSHNNKIGIKLISNPIQKQESFEFKPSCTNDYKEAFTVSADEIFDNGKIRPIFPVRHARIPSCDSQLSGPHHPHSRSESSILEPQEPPHSSYFPRHVRMSSEPIPPEFCDWKQKSDVDLGTCEWKPSSKSLEQMPLPKYKKASSIGAARFGKLRSLVGRVGPHHHHFLPHLHRPHHGSNNKEPSDGMHSKINKTEGGEKAEESQSSSSSHDATIEPRGGDGRRSHQHHHLPKKKNVANFFSNVNKFAHSRIHSF